jgi:hypothetical protein
VRSLNRGSRELENGVRGIANQIDQHLFKLIGIGNKY